MAKIYEALTPELISFIERQKIFFVATAPLAAEGHVNLSPKGHDTLRVLSPSRVAYLDFTGSGNETAAHVSENGRITFMFCSFDRKPSILRLYGQGRSVLPDDAEWAGLADRFELRLGTRQIITADLEFVQTSCGYAVPFMEFVGERDLLDRSAQAKGEEGLETYWATKNTRSLDGLETPHGRAKRRAGVLTAV